MFFYWFYYTLKDILRVFRNPQYQNKIVFSEETFLNSRQLILGKFYICLWLLLFLPWRKKKRCLLVLLVKVTVKKKKESSCTDGGKSTQAYSLVLTMIPKRVLSPQSPFTVIRDIAFSFHNPLWILLLESSTKFLESTSKTGLPW